MTCRCTVRCLRTPSREGAEVARYRTLMSTRLVVWTPPGSKIVAEPGVRNMYGCLPCPRCGSGYRYATLDSYIVCDECGKLQRAEFA